MQLPPPMLELTNHIRKDANAERIQELLSREGDSEATMVPCWVGINTEESY